MASPTLSAAVCALIFLLAVADARIFRDVQEFFPEITSTNILLPSEKPGELDSPAALKKLPEDEKEAPMVRFRPINRRFSILPTDRFRHNCRHGHNVNRLRPLTPRYGRIREIPYGNDVNFHADDQHPGFAAGTPHREIPHGNDGDKDSRFAAGNVDVPLRWTEIGYERPRVNLKDDILIWEEETPELSHRHRLGRFEKKLGVERQNEDNAIVKKIRKFLNHFKNMA